MTTMMEEIDMTWIILITLCSIIFLVFSNAKGGGKQ